MDYLYLIDKKILEHRFEIEGCQLELEKMRPSLLESIGKKDIILMQKVAILKDKTIFHIAAVETLQDLKKELTDVTPKLL